MHRTLLVTSDVSRYERLLPLLQRSDVSVHRVLRGKSALELASRVPFSVLVIALPVADLEPKQLLATVRAEGSPCRNAGVVVKLPEDDADDEHDREELIKCGANRVLAADCDSAELNAAVADLLGVAQRIGVRVPVQARLIGEVGSQLLVCETVNISETGVLVRSEHALERGSQFGFKFTLPGQTEPIRGTARAVRIAEQRIERVSGFGATFIVLLRDGPRLLAEYLDAHCP